MKKKSLAIILFSLLFAGAMIFGPFAGHIAFAQTPTATQNTTCSFGATTGLQTPVGCLTEGLATVAYFSLTFVSWLVTMSGLLLNAAVNFGVLSMKSEIDSLSVINTSWTLVRDIGNMAFIFILLYIAIATILDLEGIDTKRAIRNVIIVGLLVNFSLFFTKIFIDASNVVAISFYNLIVGNNGSIRDFSIVFTQPLGIGQFSTSDQFVQHFAGGQNPMTMITIIGIAGSVFLFAVALSFLYAAFLLIFRFIILTVLMILSPLAYFLSILPSTKSYAKKWWTILTNQLIVAPMYMIMIYIVMLINKGFSLVSGTSAATANASATPGLLDTLSLSATDIAKASGSPLDALLRFIIMLVFLNIAAILATTTANNSGGFIGGIVNKTRSTVMGAIKRAPSQAAGAASATAGAAGKAARSTVGWAATNTVGRRATRLLEKDNTEEKLKAQSLQGNVVSRTWARAQLGVLQKQAQSFRDAKSIRQQKINARAEDINKTVAQYGGATKETQDKINTANKNIAAARKAVGEAQTPEEIAKAQRDLRQEKKAKAKLEKDKKREIETQQQVYMNRRANSGWTPTPLRKNYTRAAEQFEEKHKSAETDANKVRVEDLKADLEDIIKESSKQSPETRQEFVKTEVLKAIQSNKANPKDVAKMSGTILTNPGVVKALNKNMLDAIAKENTLEDDEANKIAEQILNDSSHPANSFMSNVRQNDWWNSQAHNTRRNSQTSTAQAPRPQQAPRPVSSAQNVVNRTSNETYETAGDTYDVKDTGATYDIK